MALPHLQVALVLRLKTRDESGSEHWHEYGPRVEFDLVDHIPGVGRPDVPLRLLWGQHRGREIGVEVSAVPRRARRPCIGPRRRALPHARCSITPAGTAARRHTVRIQPSVPDAHSAHTSYCALKALVLNFSCALCFFVCRAT